MSDLFIIQPEPHPSRQRAIDAVRNARVGQRVLIQEAKKSRSQEEKYHAMFADIARDVPVNGMKLDKGQMKRVLVSAFRIDTKDDADLAPLWREVMNLPMVIGLRGEVVVLGDVIPTSQLPKALASALIEWLYALGAEHGVVWTEPLPPELLPGRRKAKAERIDAETGEILEGATA